MESTLSVAVGVVLHEVLTTRYYIPRNCVLFVLKPSVLSRQENKKSVMRAKKLVSRRYS